MNVKFEQTSPEAAGEAGRQRPRTRSQGALINRDSPPCELSGKAEVSPDFRLNTEDDDCSTCFERTGEKTIDASAHASRTNPTVQKYETSLWGEGTLNISRNASTNKIRGPGTGSTEKAAKKETEKDALMGTAPESRTISNPAPEQVLDISKAAGDSTFRASTPLDATHSDVYRFIESIRSRSSNLSPNSLSEEGDSVGLSDEKPQHQKIITVRSRDMFFPKTRPALSPPDDWEVALPINTSTRNLQSDRSPSRDGGVALPSGTAHGHLTPGPHRLSNTPHLDLSLTDRFAESKTPTRHPRSDMPVPIFKGKRLQSVIATKAEKQGLQQPYIRQPLSPDPAALVRYSSSPSLFPSTPSPKMRFRDRDRNALGDPDGPHTYDSTSLPTDPFTSTPENSSRASTGEEADEFVGSSPLVKNELDAEDDSLSEIALATQSPDRNRRSTSTALICIPSPGSLVVMWKWSFTKNRRMKLPAFFFIVQNLCIDLTTREIPKGYIYAFSVEDPQKNNYVKVGVCQDIDRRTREHTDCYGELKQIYPPKGQGSVQVYHAGRVERLIHAELVQHAIQIERCPNFHRSHRSHREWFDVEESHAIAVIRKWSEWMSCSPYEEGPPTGIIKKISPNKTRASGTSPKAKSPESKVKSKSKSPSAKTSKRKAPQTSTPSSTTTRWHLRDMDPFEIMDLCWPLARHADGLDETALVKFEPSCNDTASAELI
jgi:T5orf172 domain